MVGIDSTTPSVCKCTTRCPSCLLPAVHVYVFFSFLSFDCTFFFLPYKSNRRENNRLRLEAFGLGIDFVLSWLDLVILLFSLFSLCARISRHPVGKKTKIWALGRCAHVLVPNQVTGSLPTRVLCNLYAWKTRPNHKRGFEDEEEKAWYALGLRTWAACICCRCLHALYRIVLHT